jgi:hypothetical protein
MDELDNVAPEKSFSLLAYIIAILASPFYAILIISIPLLIIFSINPIYHWFLLFPPVMISILILIIMISIPIANFISSLGLFVAIILLCLPFIFFNFRNMIPFRKNDTKKL